MSYVPISYANMALFSSAWKLPPKPVIFMDLIHLSITMNNLWLKVLPDVWTSALIDMIFLSASNSPFITSGSLWSTWLLVSSGGLAGTWNPSDTTPPNHQSQELCCQMSLLQYTEETAHPMYVHQSLSGLQCKLLNQLFDHDPRLLLIIHFFRVDTSISRYVGVVPSKLVSLRAAFILLNKIH